jgi:beta-mannanase
MAQTGFTPISNYYSATVAAVPTAGNLVAGELAINTADGKLFYKDSAGVVQTIASKATAALPTTTTGSGSIVLATSPTVTTPIVLTTIGVGGATPSASGAGVTFPATQSNSSNANTLDDYEEGTWTPSVGGTATYNAQVGYYTKIGNVVTVAFDMYILSIGTGSATTISGLPFTTANNTAYNENGSAVAYFADLDTTVTYLTAVVNKNSTSLHFDGLTIAGTSMTTSISAFKNGTDLYCTITYLIS